MCSHFPLWCKCCMLQEEGAEGEKVIHFKESKQREKRPIGLWQASFSKLSYGREQCSEDCKRQYNYQSNPKYWFSRISFCAHDFFMCKKTVFFEFVKNNTSAPKAALFLNSS